MIVDTQESRLTLANVPGPKMDGRWQSTRMAQKWLTFFWSSPVQESKSLLGHTSIKYVSKKIATYIHVWGQVAVHKERRGLCLT